MALTQVSPSQTQHWLRRKITQICLARTAAWAKRATTGTKAYMEKKITPKVLNWGTHNNHNSCPESRNQARWRGSLGSRLHCPCHLCPLPPILCSAQNELGSISACPNPSHSSRFHSNSLPWCLPWYSHKDMFLCFFKFTLPTTYSSPCITVICYVHSGIGIGISLSLLFWWYWNLYSKPHTCQALPCEPCPSCFCFTFLIGPSIFAWGWP
jgi:hypothetical protein